MMKTKRGGGRAVPVLKSRCKRKLRSTTIKWGQRILFAVILLIIFQLGQFIYSNVWKSETSYSSERVNHVHVGRRKLLSEGVVWEQCHFEKAHTPHAFLPLYVFLIFLLFVGKKKSF